MTDEQQFNADFDGWRSDSKHPGKWFGPHCACIEYARQRLAAGTFSESALNKAWKEFKARDHETIVARWLVTGDLANDRDLQASLKSAQSRCRDTLRGLIATIDAAALIVGQGWRAGLALPGGIRECLASALTAYQNAWGLAPGGKRLPLLSRKLQGTGSIALEAMIEVVGEQGVDEETAPAWLAVHRLLDYLLTGSASSSATVAAAVTPQVAGTPRLPRPQPGSSENPILVRVLFACRGSSVGQMHDLFAMRQDAGPASWYLDPVQFGLTAFQPEFIDSLRLGWRACQANQTPSAAIRLAPALVDCKIVHGPSAGAVAACAMYAALVGEQLNSDASASAALTLRPGQSLDDGQPIRLEDIVLGDVGFIREKLGAAHQGRQKSSRLGPLAAPLRKVVFTEAQARDAIEAGWHRPKSGPAISVPGVAISVPGAANLGEVYAHLTGNARIERALEAYCQDKAKEWDDSWTGRNEFSKQTDLIYYVPPHYALLKDDDARRAGKSTRARPEEEGVERDAYEYFRQDNEDENLAALLKEEKAGLRFCLEDAPGAGKTIFTRRLLGFLSSTEGRAALLDGQPGLAMRWEEAKGDWPENFDDALRTAVASSCDQQCDPSEVVDYAWKHGRVTLILDALDQADDKQVEVFRQFLNTLDERRVKCRIVLTGRPYAVELHRGDLLPMPTWRFGKIEPFTPWQQYVYLRGPTAGRPDAPDTWRKRSIEPDRTVEPGRKKLQIDEVTVGQDPLPALREFWSAYSTTPDLFMNPQNLQMIRELAEFGQLGDLRHRTDLYQEISRRRIERDYVRHYHKPDKKTQARLERMLAAAAFQMLVDHPKQHRVDGEDSIQRLMEEAGRRLNPPATAAEWTLLAEVTALTNRTLLMAASSESFAWPDPRMMEFFAGLHLANNEQPQWADSVDDPNAAIRCGEMAVRLNAARPEWHEVWKHALLIWPERRKDRVLLASVAELYEPVAQREQTPWLRPTELLYRAWCLLEELPEHERAQPSPQLLQHGGRVLAAFREQFRRQLGAGGDVEQVARAVEGGFVEVQKLDPKLVPAPLALTQPRTITIDSFLLGRTAVTREQYGLFDAAYLDVHKQRDSFVVKSPRCPAQWITWYDAWCAARYFGGRLPTEAEWEYACGAGSRKKYCRIKASHGGGYEDLDDAEGLKKVADFGRSWNDGPREVDQGANGLLTENAFRLIGMHGGVWEWCSSWYVDREFYQSLEGDAATNPPGSADGSDRVLRGGSWLYDADFCRTAYRYGYDPSSRNVGLGFRLARVREAEPVPAVGQAKRAGA